MCDRVLRKFDVQTSSKPSNYVLGIIFVVNIKFPLATHHTIVPSTEELSCLNSKCQRKKTSLKLCFSSSICCRTAAVSGEVY